MVAENAKLAAEAWLETASLPADLKGRQMQVVVFENEEDCRFFYPRRALLFQQQITTYIARNIRIRGAKIVRVTVTQANYMKWLSEASQEDSPQHRREFVDDLLKLL